MPDRRAARLLTLDRALLVIAIGVGGWVATKDLKQDQIEIRVNAQSGMITALQADTTQLQIQNAIVNTKLDNLTLEVQKLREVLERKLP